MVSEKGFQVFYLVQNDGYLAWVTEPSTTRNYLEGLPIGGMTN